VIDGDEAAMMGTALDPDRRPTPRREGVVVNDDVEAVFETALAVDPRERYQLVKHFWGDLTRAVGRLDRRSTLPPAPQLPAAGGSAKPPGGPFPRVEVPPLQLPQIPSLPDASPVQRVSSRPSGPAEDPFELALDDDSVVGLADPPVGVLQSPRPPDPTCHVSAAPSKIPRVDRWIGPPPLPAPQHPQPGGGWLASVLTRLLPGLALAVVAIAISVLGQVYAARTGTPLPVGWLAGPLLLVGIGVTIYRFLPGGTDSA
jgi:hypothetical protein